LTKVSIDVFVNEAHPDRKLCPQRWGGVKKYVTYQYCCWPGASVFHKHILFSRELLTWMYW